MGGGSWNGPWPGGASPSFPDGWSIIVNGLRLTYGNFDQYCGHGDSRERTKRIEFCLMAEWRYRE